jgi:hypothetical protein
MLPRTIDGMKHVCYFRHALALDERRVKFLPEYAYGGTTAGPEDQHILAVGSGLVKDNVLLSANEDPSIVNPVSDEDTFIVGNESGTNNVPPSRMMIDHGSPDNTPPTQNEDTVNRPQVRKDSIGKHPHTVEVWFAGTHSDM